jgi:CheY-like chemotaxis protein
MEQLLKISELNLAGKIEQMDENKQNNYIQLLNSFTDNLPGQDKKIKNSLDEKDYDSLAKHLSAVRDILGKIYADAMAQDCTKQINGLGSEKHEKIEAYTRYFLSSLSMLSSDIQTAQQQMGASAAASRKDAVVESADGSKNKKENHKTINTERLLDISGLNLAGKIEQMDEDSFNNYVQLLGTFTENYPEQEEKIKAALEAKDDDALKKNLSEVRNILEKIYADEMARDCAKQISEIGSTKHEKIETFMRYFLSSLSMLSIDIQMAEEQIDLSVAAPVNEPTNTVSREEKKILAVDDTIFFLTMLKKNLQDTRYKLTCVASGKDALKYLEKRHPDIFLLDIEMPIMDGYELAEKIREKGYKEPIVFLTGNAKKEHLAKAMKAGATDFIIKPINKDVLLDKIRKYLR